MWLYLKNNQLEGVHFRRQRPIGKYIVDFVSRKHKLILEIDGGHHNEDIQIQKDNERTTYLKEQGYIVLRIWNKDITENLEGVLEIIRLAITSP